MIYKVGVLVSVILSLALSVKEIISYYTDIYLDTAIGSGLHHMEKYFLTSIKKAKLISFIDIGVMKYYFPGLGFLSTFLMHIFYVYNVRTFSYFRPELKYRLITFISFLFPVTFTVLECFRNLITQQMLKDKICEKVSSLSVFKM